VPASSATVKRSSTIAACTRALAGIILASCWGDRDDQEPFALEFLRCLPKPQGVIDDRRAVARGEVTSNPTLTIEKPAVRCNVRIVASPVEAASRLDALDAQDRPLPGSDEEAATLLDAYLAREVDGSIVTRTVAPTSQGAA
jgi:hypothetical protein